MQRYYGTVTDGTTGRPVEGATVTVFTSGVTNPLPSLFSTGGSGTPSTQILNPITTDTFGNFGFAAPDGRYDIQISGGNMPTLLLPNICLFDNTISYPSPALGTVTSVSLTAPSIFAIAGSPVTGSGTIALSLTSQTANTFFAAPSGSSGQPVFRSIQSSDLPTVISGATTGNNPQLLPIVTYDNWGRIINVAQMINAPKFSDITSKPSTVSGYGIVDAAAIGAYNAWTKGQNSQAVALTPGANVSVDYSLSNVFTLTPTSNFTLNNPSSASPASGATIQIQFTQDAVGSRVISWGSKYKFANATAGVLSTAANAKDTLYATYDAVNDIWRCVLSKNFA